MFGKRKETPTIDPQQRELIENAQRRVKQKKRLWSHFIVFVIGSIFLILMNTVLGFGKDVQFFGRDWFVFAILIWIFFFLIHVVNVLFTTKFMGKAWEQRQLDILVQKQQDKIDTLNEQVQLDFPLPEKKTPVQF